MNTVDLADGTPVIRKVQWAAVWATLGATVGSILAYPLAATIANAVPMWQGEGAFLALSTLIELAIVGLSAGGGALAAGWYTRSRAADLVAKEPVQ